MELTELNEGNDLVSIQRYPFSHYKKKLLQKKDNKVNEIGRLESIHMIILGWKLLQQTQVCRPSPAIPCVSVMIHSFKNFPFNFTSSLFFYQQLPFLLKNICLCFTDIIKVIILYWSVSNACPFPLECRIQRWSLHCSMLICNCEAYDLGNHRHRLLGGSEVKKLPAQLETQIWSQGQEDPLEEGMATHSNILAWETSWREEPGEL